jgi:hypothetical protein
MAEKKLVLKDGNTIQSLGISMYAIVYLLFDKLNFPGWAYGVAFTILGIYTISSIIQWFTTEQINIEDIK